ncbi:hypothetical protein ACN47E_008309 [Coniothyrium glycines]
MEDSKVDHAEDRSLLQYAMDTVLLPIRIATSPVLLRTYLRTILLFLTSSVLFGVAVVAYSSFYYSYIPVRGISVPVYLQYEHDATTSYTSTATSTTPGLCAKTSKWPYGIANVPGLVDRQKYNVVVNMVVPRTESNLRAGNWMVGLEMRGPGVLGGSVMSMLGWDEEWSVEDHSQSGVAGATAEKATADSAASGKASVLARSRRPAILTFRSYVVEHVYRAMRLPLYLVGWHTESETVEISMMEDVMFEAGWKNVPTSLRVELRSKYPLDVYRVSVQISARLEGLRWLMFRYFFSSAIIGITLFWSVEMGVLLFTWAAFTLLIGTSRDESSIKVNPEDRNRQIKQEPRDDASHPDTPLSDTSRTFPTLSSQQPLSYTSTKEETEPEVKLEDIPTREDAEADDEDDDFVLEEPLPRLVGGPDAGFTDSGIGTSFESSLERERERGVERRRSGRRERGG